LCRNKRRAIIVGTSGIKQFGFNGTNRNIREDYQVTLDHQEPKSSKV
jgi:hypothetical protein